MNGESGHVQNMKINGRQRKQKKRHCKTARHADLIAIYNGDCKRSKAKLIYLNSYSYDLAALRYASGGNLIKTGLRHNGNQPRQGDGNCRDLIQRGQTSIPVSA